MSQSKHKKVTFEFPANEYVYLKIACAKQGVSIKDFITQATLRSLEEYENELDLSSLEEARKDIKKHDLISWEEMEKKLGWDKL